MARGARVGSILVRIGAQTTDFDKSLQRVLGQVNKFATNLTRIGGAMTRAFALPLAGIGAAAVKFGADFERALTTSTAIMGDLSDEMRSKLSESARAIAKESTFSASEAAEAYYFLASAGLDAQQSIASLPAVIDFATAGQFELASATDLLTDAQSALGLSVEDATGNYENMVRVSDALVKANTIANASVQQFSEALTNKGAASLRLVGKELEEGLAVLAAWATQGVKGAEAGTKLEIVLRDLQRAAIEGTNSNQEFNDAVYDATGQMRNMADIVGWLETQFADLSPEQRKVALMQLGLQERTVSATASLIGFSDAIRQYEQDLNSAGGATKDVAEKQLDTFWARMTMLWHRVQDIGIELGQTLIPILDDLAKSLDGVVQWVGNLVQGFSELSDGVKGAVVKIGALVVAIGPLLLALGAITQGATFATAGLGKLILAVQTHPVIALTTAIAALAVALPAVAVEMRAAAIAQQRLNAAIDAGVAPAEELIAEIERLEKRIKEAFAAAANQSHKYGVFGGGMTRGGEGVRELIERLEALKEALRKARIEEALLSIYDASKQAESQFRRTANVIEYSERAITRQERVVRAWEDALITLQGQVGNLTEQELSVFTRGLERAREELENLKDISSAPFVGPQMPDMMPDANIQSGLWSPLVEGIQESLTSVTDLWDGLGLLQERMSTGLSEAIVGTREGLTSLQAGFSELVEYVSATVPEAFDILETTLGQAVERTRDFGLSMLTGTLDVMHNMILGFTNGIGRAVATALVYGESFGKTMKKIMLSIAATFIQSFISMGIQTVLFFLLSKTQLFADKALKTAKLSSDAAQGAIAQTFIWMPPFVAEKLAPIRAAFAKAMVLGAGMFAEGGVIRGPTLGMLGERGTELVLPLDRADEFLGSRQLVVNAYLDGEVLSQSVIRNLPGELSILYGA